MDNSLELPRHGGPHIHTIIVTTAFLEFYYPTNLKAAAASLADMLRFPNQVFKELYLLRWGVETYYDRLKKSVTGRGIYRAQA
ncbi:MAG: hypothetical protein AAF944_26550 [Bacteroidota bacterium]